MSNHYIYVVLNFLAKNYYKLTKFCQSINHFFILNTVKKD